ncbi:hypothetical protein IFM89_034299 [Coptis chinensis]|uniref:Uncharacterized protein n=1 Tax=Coptis chinensis TaxID=261450 RepID=A0A835IIF3_9MAGN|nr:hypothetical protein IFM89_034299 [Coptis chinensis]
MESPPTWFAGLSLSSSHSPTLIWSCSTSFKEQSAHVTSVKNILESHASYLMSGKELSNLVAFVKGTQFDLVEYLQRERNGCAHLENFASGLELIGQKSQPAFSEYSDLLKVLEEQLPTVGSSEER